MLLDLNKAAEEMRTDSLSERGRHLREYRKKLGLDIDSVAQAAGVAKSSLSKFERGKNDLRVENYAKLLLAMNRIDAYQEALYDYIKQDIRKSAKLVPLSKLADVKSSDYTGSLFVRMPRSELKKWIRAKTKQHFQKTLEERSQALIRENEAEIARLKAENAQLRDLLNLETKAALAENERDELREKIKRGKE